MPLLAGCFGNEKTSFPEGLEPLEEITVEPPDAVDGDPYPETLRMESGSISQYDWVQARGYVKAPMRDVFVALSTPEAVVDRREVARWSVRHDVEPEYDVSFVTRNEVDDIITVEFDVTWRFGVVEGNAEAPTLVAGNWQKTWGTTFIDVLRGSVIAERVEADVTEVAFVEHIRAAERGTGPLETYIEDYFRNTVELAHGRPVPEY